MERIGQLNFAMLRSPDLRPDANELTAIGSDSLTYDASGNLISRVESGGSTWSYEYDAWNRLVKVVVTPSGESAEDRAEFRYNALNHRAWRHVDTSSPPVAMLTIATDTVTDAVDRVLRFFEDH